MSKVEATIWLEKAAKLEADANNIANLAAGNESVGNKGMARYSFGIAMDLEAEAEAAFQEALKAEHSV